MNGLEIGDRTVAAPTTISDLVQLAASRFGDSTWLVEPDAAGETTSFATAGARVSRLASLLAANGVGPGDRVAVSLGNSWRFLVGWFAINWLGATVVPLNTALTGSEADRILVNCAAKTWIVETTDAAVARCAAEAGRNAETIAINDLLEQLPAAPACDPAPTTASDVASLLYTSGTTSAPKGCACSHYYYLTAADRYCQLIELTERDRLSTCLPLFHAGAQITSAIGSLRFGVPLVLQRRFSASRFFGQLATTGATVFNYIGAIPAILMARPPAENDRRHCLRVAWGGGIPKDMHAKFEERFGVTVLESYGSTELGATIATPLGSDRHVGSSCCGVPYPGPEVALVDPVSGDHFSGAGTGELYVRDAAMFSGYYGSNGSVRSALDDHGWFHTGDLLRRDEQGTYYFVERADDRIRRAGENISPEEIEILLRRHPAVLEAAVIGLPDPLLGEVPFAFIRLTDPASAESGAIAELLARCRAELAYFKVPVGIRVIDDFPRTSTQRIQKRQLRELARARANDPPPN